MSDAATPRIFQKGYLPAEVNRHNSDVAVHINRFPLGDIDNFSVARASYAIAQQKHGSGDAWTRWAPWEKHYLAALSEVTFKAQGDQVSGIDGGYLAPEVWGSKLFGLLRSFSALDQLPISRMSVPARVAHIPRVTGDITISYPGESGTIPASQFKLGQISYTPRKATARVLFSNELMRDAPEMVDALIQNQAAEAFATDRDTQLLTANAGGVGPVGLLYHPSIKTYYPVMPSVTAGTPATAASPSYRNVGQLIQIVENLNNSANVTAGQTTCTGMIAHSQFKQTVLASTNFQDGQGRPLWFQDLNANGGMFGQTWALTNVMPINLTVAGNANCSAIIAGRWSRYLLMEAQTFTFDATAEGQGFQNDQTEVRLTYRYDGAAANIEAFGVLAGVLV